MFGSGVLEIAIGMLFIYLLLSTISSALNEWIGGLTASRSRSLQAGVRNLLNDPKGKGLAKEVLNHPLIKSLESPGWFSIPGLLGKGSERFKRPQYLSSDLFVTAILDQIVPLGKDSPARTFTDIWNNLHDRVEAAAKQADATAETWKSLLAIARTVMLMPNNLESFRKSLADWYDESMERVSGWYKRKTQLMLMLISAVLSVAINADGVMYLQYLNQDSMAREAIAAAARLRPGPIERPAQCPAPIRPERWQRRQRDDERPEPRRRSRQAASFLLAADRMGPVSFQPFRFLGELHP